MVKQKAHRCLAATWAESTPAHITGGKTLSSLTVEHQNNENGCTVEEIERSQIFRELGKKCLNKEHVEGQAKELEFYGISLSLPPKTNQKLSLQRRKPRPISGVVAEGLTSSHPSSLKWVYLFFIVQQGRISRLNMLYPPFFISNSVFQKIQPPKSSIIFFTEICKNLSSGWGMNSSPTFLAAAE